MVSAKLTWLVSDRPDWLQRLTPVLRAARWPLALVQYRWRAVRRAGEGLPHLICWDLSEPEGSPIDTLERFNGRAYQYASIV